MGEWGGLLLVAMSGVMGIGLIGYMIGYMQCAKDYGQDHPQDTKGADE